LEVPPLGIRRKSNVMAEEEPYRPESECKWLTRFTERSFLIGRRPVSACMILEAVQNVKLDVNIRTGSFEPTTRLPRPAILCADFDSINAPENCSPSPQLFEETPGENPSLEHKTAVYDCRVPALWECPDTLRTIQRKDAAQHLRTRPEVVKDVATVGAPAFGEGAH